MIAKDLSMYATSNWSGYKTSITENSKSDKGNPLVESDIEVYNFDKIVKDMFPNTDCPSSTDGIKFKGNTIQLIEFKSGFKQKISKQRFDVKKGTCPKSEEVCSDYWGVFWENQERKINQLVESIKLKAIESYILLEKNVFPLCDDIEKPNNIILSVVVDEDGVDGIEDILADVAEYQPDTNNCLISIKNALRRLIKQKDANNNDYFYDQIDVYSATEYMKKIESIA